MSTTMRQLPVRTTGALRRLIDAAGPVNPATRALLILGAAQAGLPLDGLEREVAGLLAAGLEPRVHRALQQQYAALIGQGPVLPAAPAPAPAPLTTADSPNTDDPFARVGIAV